MGILKLGGFVLDEVLWNFVIPLFSFFIKTYCLKRIQITDNQNRKINIKTGCSGLIKEDFFIFGEFLQRESPKRQRETN
jgi:hypothetical protein